MKAASKFLAAVLFLSLLTASVSCAPGKDVDPSLLQGPGWTTADNNLHLIEGPPPDQGPAFRVYRSGAPSRETFARWCEVYHIERVIDMAGTADTRELEYQEEGLCPGIEVVYSVGQDPVKPVSDGFLEFFDREVKRAREDGAGLLFRCTTGSHRAGRTAAYFQMKHQGLTPEEAIAVMDYNGMLMPLYDPVLRPQVRALHDHINGDPCSQKRKFCVETDSDKWAP